MVRFSGLKLKAFANRSSERLSRSMASACALTSVMVVMMSLSSRSVPISLEMSAWKTVPSARRPRQGNWSMWRSA